MATTKDAKERYYLHGDIVEDDPSTFYDRRADSFLPLSKVEPILYADIARLRYQLSLPRKTVPRGKTRPADAPNVFASHEWMSMHGRRLKKLALEEQLARRDVLRRDDK